MIEQIQTGLTTEQMKSAPQGAIFVWLNERIQYPVFLARHLGRTDLKIVRPSWIEDKHFRSHDNPVIIYDHAFWSIVRSSRMHEAIEFAEIYLSKKRPDPDDPMAPCNNHGGWSK